MFMKILWQQENISLEAIGLFNYNEVVRLKDNDRGTVH